MTSETASELAPIDRAVQAVGSLGDLARRIGVSSAVLINWRKRGIPPLRVLDVERATADDSGRPRVTRSELRPDLYPPAEPLRGEGAGRAIDMLGGPAKVIEMLAARGIHKTQTELSAWYREVPPEFVLVLEDLTDRRFRRHQFRPDIYPPERVAA